MLKIFEKKIEKKISSDILFKGLFVLSTSRKIEVVVTFPNKLAFKNKQLFGRSAFGGDTFTLKISVNEFPYYFRLLFRLVY